MEKHQLHKYVLSSDENGVALLIKQGVNIDELDELGNSPLHWAVMRGDYATVKQLLEAGANPNILSTDGITPKWSAADWGLQDIANLLDSFGGKINTDDHFDKASWSVFKIALGQTLPENEK